MGTIQYKVTTVQQATMEIHIVTTTHIITTIHNYNHTLSWLAIMNTIILPLPSGI